MVVRLAERVGEDVVAECEPTLAAAAAQLDPVELDRVCHRVRAHADPDGAEPDAGKDFARRGMTMAAFDGCADSTTASSTKAAGESGTTPHATR